jgi:hypothetical protein
MRARAVTGTGISKRRGRGWGKYGDGEKSKVGDGEKLKVGDGDGEFPVPVTALMRADPKYRTYTQYIGIDFFGTDQATQNILLSVYLLQCWAKDTRL